MKPSAGNLRENGATGKSPLSEQLLAGRARHSVRADFRTGRRAEDCPPYQPTCPQAHSYSAKLQKNAREISRALFNA